MKRLVALSVLLALASQTLGFGKVKGNQTAYVGGTVSSLTAPAKGELVLADEKVLVFDSDNGKLSVPYDRVNSLEYGQKAGRRLGLAIAVTPLALFSKKRRHFLTMGYQDENDKQQAAVFEMGKNTVRVTLATLEARTGRKIEYQDEEARKSGLGGD